MSRVPIPTTETETVTGRSWTSAVAAQTDAACQWPCEIRRRPLTAVEPEDVLVMAFGRHTASGQTRLDLTRANLAMCEEVARHVEVGGLPSVCLVATSPLDVLTEYLTRRWAGRMVNVIGSGTSLDTWRLRGELSSICRVHPTSVHAWVVGEHGDRL